MEKGAKKKMEQKNNSGKIYLDKTGLVIFIISLVVALALIISGIIVIAGNNKDSDGDNNTTTGGTNTITTISAYDNYYENVDIYTYKEYEFSPTTSGYYSIYVDGAQMTRVSDAYSNKSYSSTSSSSYENAYLINLQAGSTYKLKFYAQSYYINIYIVKT